MVVPTVLMIEYKNSGKVVSQKIMMSLAILLGGVAVATVTDMSVNLRGSIYGAIAVLTTAQFQALVFPPFFSYMIGCRCGKVQNKRSLI